MRKVAFRKEYSFKYENEFRFVVQSKRIFTKDGYTLNLGEPAKLNFSVLVNPLLEQVEYNQHLSNLLSNSIGLMKHKDSALVRWLKPSKW